MTTDPTTASGRRSPAVTAIEVRARLAAAQRALEEALPGMPEMAEGALRGGDAGRAQAMAHRITDILNEAPVPNNGTRMMALAMVLTDMLAAPDAASLSPRERGAAAGVTSLLALVFHRLQSERKAKAGAQEARPAGDGR